jgi:hypothetical protein
MLFRAGPQGYCTRGITPTSPQSGECRIKGPLAGSLPPPGVYFEDDANFYEGRSGGVPDSNRRKYYRPLEETLIGDWNHAKHNLDRYRRPL